MAIKNYKPTTPGRRGMSTLSNEEITTNKPEKSLLEVKTKKAGRNNRSSISNYIIFFTRSTANIRFRERLVNVYNKVLVICN